MTKWMRNCEGMGTFAKTISRLAVLTALALPLGNCAMFTCAGWEKIEPSQNDTAKTKRQVLSHNNFGRRQSCWK